MLADLRFVLGAILAVTLLAVTGLGVVASVALMREAHVRPIEDSRSLAYAGPSGHNAFYDPDGPWRMARDSAPTMEPQTPPAVAPEEVPEQTASIPAHPPAMAAAPVIAEDSEPPHASETFATAPSTPDAPPAEKTDAPSVERIASAPAAELDAPPAERVEPVPATPPATDQPPPILFTASEPKGEGTQAPPTPRPRPTLQPRKRISRAHIRPPSVAAAPPQQNSWAPWPIFGQQPVAATAATKTAGSLASRPQ